MAIDTRFKRFNMMEFGGVDIVLPEADGAIDADDRAQLITLYGGNALGAEEETKARDDIQRLRRRRW